MPQFGETGERIGYQLYSHADPLAPTLLLLHGFTATRAAFDVNLPALRRHFTVVTIELLGHGESDAPEAAAPYTAEATSARIVALMDHLRLDRVVFCGHSLGGAVALRVVLDAPDRFDGLIVMNSNSAAMTSERRAVAQASMTTLAARLRAEGTAFLRKSTLYPAASKRLDEHSRAALARGFEALHPAGVAGTAEGLIAGVNCHERLAELNVPTLLVVGARDRAFMPNLPSFLERLPNHVQLVTLAEAGHAVNIESPREFETAVIGFAGGLFGFGREA